MTGKLTARSAESLAKRKGRWLDGGGLFLRTLEPGQKTYWVYRYRLDNRDREASVGSYPAMTLAQARIRHAELRAQVLKGIDPVGERRKAKAPKPKSDAGSFGAFSDAYVERKEKRGELGKNPKHRQQWRNTLAKLPAWFRDLPVDEIGPQQIFEALDPIWTATPETGGRLRGRIAAVLDSARGRFSRFKPRRSTTRSIICTLLGGRKGRTHGHALDAPPRRRARRKAITPRS